MRCFPACPAPLLLASFLAGSACGRVSPARSSAPSRVAPDEQGRQGDLHCRVRLRGSAPPPPRIHPDKNVEHCGASLEDPVLLVSDGGIENAVVWVALPGRAAATVEGGERVLTNKGCQMEPRIQTARPGVRLVLRNEDPITHNPHGWNERGLSAFNVTLIDTRLEVGRTLKEPGVYRVDCDTHTWMHAFVHVFDHPFHALSDFTGSAVIRALPSGRHVLQVWHEVLGRQELEVVIEDGRTAEVEVTFELADRRPDKLIPSGMEPWVTRAGAGSDAR